MKQSNKRRAYARDYQRKKKLIDPNNYRNYYKTYYINNKDKYNQDRDTRKGDRLKDPEWLLNKIKLIIETF